VATTAGAVRLRSWATACKTLATSSYDGKAGISAAHFCLSNDAVLPDTNSASPNWKQGRRSTSGPLRAMRTPMLVASAVKCERCQRYSWARPGRCRRRLPPRRKRSPVRPGSAPARASTASVSAMLGGQSYAAAEKWERCVPLRLHDDRASEDRGQVLIRLRIAERGELDAHDPAVARHPHSRHQPVVGSAPGQRASLRQTGNTAGFKGLLPSIARL
jgi:hypothetical protein